mmetsp:Transcript_34790/g.92314  ORF Transcript_34790/g.92314 Transcript_34790/m.92314 type:complete len:319 (+) Transcript_34790:433-1389(+)
MRPSKIPLALHSHQVSLHTPRIDFHFPAKVCMWADSQLTSQLVELYSNHQVPTNWVFFCTLPSLGNHLLFWSSSAICLSSGPLVAAPTRRTAPASSNTLSKIWRRIIPTAVRWITIWNFTFPYHSLAVISPRLLHTEVGDIGGNTVGLLFVDLRIPNNRDDIDHCALILFPHCVHCQPKDRHERLAEGRQIRLWVGLLGLFQAGCHFRVIFVRGQSSLGQEAGRVQQVRLHHVWLDEGEAAGVHEGDPRCEVYKLLLFLASTSLGVLASLALGPILRVVALPRASDAADGLRPLGPLQVERLQAHLLERHGEHTAHVE